MRSLRLEVPAMAAVEVIFMPASIFSSLETSIGFSFKEKKLLEEALRHSSFVNEVPEAGLRDNERLEFLGDAVLNLAVGHILLSRCAYLHEGDLSRMRATLVNEHQLAQMARRLNLGAVIKLGKGEAQTGGFEKDSILAGALEALMAAVYLDGGFEAAFEIIQKAFQPLLQQLDSGNGHADYKSQLQEWVQARPGTMPSYTVIREEGPDHTKTFWVQLRVMGVETQGVGKSKKAAEQDAARQALALINTR
jgi:ribonuclease III